MKAIKDLDKIVEISNLIYSVINHYRDKGVAEDDIPAQYKSWEVISRIAAENAAKPEIQGVSLHE